MNKKLYVGNLPWSITESELRECFFKVGEPVSVKIILDRDTGRSRGFGFVEMATEAETLQAIKELSGEMLGSRSLVIREARPENASPPPPSDNVNFRHSSADFVPPDVIDFLQVATVGEEFNFMFDGRHFVVIAQ